MTLHSIPPLSGRESGVPRVGGRRRRGARKPSNAVGGKQAARAILTAAVAITLLADAAPVAARTLPQRRCIVPKLSGKTVAAARQAATRAHCRIGNVTNSIESAGQPLIVATQTPRAGRKEPANTRISLTTKIFQQPPAAIPGTLNAYDFNGDELQVTVPQIVDPATPFDEFNQPSASSRLLAVELSLTNASAATVDDNANLDVSVIGTDLQTYTASFDSVADCTNFDAGDYTILPGDTQMGCVVFEVPNGVAVRSVQFKLGNGTVQFNDG